MTLGLKEYIWWSTCFCINILEDILLMLSLPLGSTNAAFFLIWGIILWIDSLSHILLNMCDKGQKFTSATPLLCDAIEVFPQSTSHAKLAEGVSGSLLVSAILQRSVWKQHGWMCPVRHWFQPQSCPLRWCTGQLTSLMPCGAASGRRGGRWMSEVIDDGTFSENCSVAERA